MAYRSAAWLPRSLGALPSALAEHDHEVLVVDNASPDDSAELVRAHFPTATVLRPGTNLGFARAVNLAAANARGRWLLLLNPDTEARPGSLDRLVRFAADHPDRGIVGARTLDEDGAWDRTNGRALPSLWSRTAFALGLSTAFRDHRWLDPESPPRWTGDEPLEVGMVSGAVAVVERRLWDELGGFDETYWMYGEDVDLSRRLRLRGYRPTLAPDAEVPHALGASAATRADKRVQVLRGSVTYDRSHAPAWQRPLRRWLLLLGTLLRASLARVTDRDDDGWAGAWSRRSEWRHGYAEERP